MSDCPYCDHKTNCVKDFRTFSTGRAKFVSIRTVNQKIGEALQQIAAACSDAFYTSEQEEISRDLAALPVAFADLMESEKGRLDLKREELDGLYDQYCRSCHTWHENHED